MRALVRCLLLVWWFHHAVINTLCVHNPLETWSMNLMHNTFRSTKGEEKPHSVVLTTLDGSNVDSFTLLSHTADSPVMRAHTTQSGDIPKSLNFVTNSTRVLQSGVWLSVPTSDAIEPNETHYFLKSSLTIPRREGPECIASIQIVPMVSGNTEMVEATADGDAEQDAEVGQLFEWFNSNESYEIHQQYITDYHVGVYHLCTPTTEKQIGHFRIQLQLSTKFSGESDASSHIQERGSARKVPHLITPLIGVYQYLNDAHSLVQELVTLKEDAKLLDFDGYSSDAWTVVVAVAVPSSTTVKTLDDEMYYMAEAIDPVSTVARLQSWSHRSHRDEQDAETEGAQSSADSKVVTVMPLVHSWESLGDVGKIQELIGTFGWFVETDDDLGSRGLTSKDGSSLLFSCGEKDKTFASLGILVNYLPESMTEYEAHYRQTAEPEEGMPSQQPIQKTYTSVIHPLRSGQLGATRHTSLAVKRMLWIHGYLLLGKSGENLEAKIFQKLLQESNVLAKIQISLFREDGLISCLIVIHFQSWLIQNHLTPVLFNAKTETSRKRRSESLYAPFFGSVVHYPFLRTFEIPSDVAAVDFSLQLVGPRCNWIAFRDVSITSTLLVRSFKRVHVPEALVAKPEEPTKPLKQTDPPRNPGNGEPYHAALLLSKAAKKRILLITVPVLFGTALLGLILTMAYRRQTLPLRPFHPTRAAPQRMSLACNFFSFWRRGSQSASKRKSVEKQGNHSSCGGSTRYLNFFSGGQSESISSYRSSVEPDTDFGEHATYEGNIYEMYENLDSLSALGDEPVKGNRESQDSIFDDMFARNE